MTLEIINFCTASMALNVVNWKLFSCPKNLSPKKRIHWISCHINFELRLISWAVELHACKLSLTNRISSHYNYTIVKEEKGEFSWPTPCDMYTLILLCDIVSASDNGKNVKQRRTRNPKAWPRRNVNNDNENLLSKVHNLEPLPPRHSRESSKEFFLFNCI